MRRALISAGVFAATLLAVAVPPALGRGFFGVIVQTPIGDADVPQLREARPGSVRLLMLWNDVQVSEGPCTPSGDYNPGSGAGANNCDWSSLDQIVGAAAAAGARVLPFAFGSPPWLDSARKATNRYPWVPPLYSASDRRAWRGFLRAAVDRYGRGGAYWEELGEELGIAARPPTHWQIWNEPTSPAYFAPHPDVAKYVRLLKLSHAVVERADRRAKVMLAGVFATPRVRGGGIDMLEFFEQLYEVRGAEKSFDVAAMHPYAPDVSGVKQQIAAARELMDEGGDRRTKLWISELGWSSDGPKGHTLTDTRRGQARMLRQAFELLLRKRRAWGIAGVNWFSWRDARRGQSSCAACPWSGLLERDGTEKPAFRAFKKFTH